MNIQERYDPIVVAANTTIQLVCNSIGGFLCSADGTITLVSNANDGNPQVTLLSAFPVVAGVYYPIPIWIGKNGGSFTTASDAAGLLLS